jgi:tetratricopeptide (TPR) repeat protein
VKAGPIVLKKLEEEADSLLENGKLRRAERMLLRLLDCDRNYLPAHFNLARVYRRTAQYDLAIQHSRRTLKLNPAETNAHLNLGMIYDEMGRDSQAAKHYLMELRTNPTSPEAMCYLGNIYFRKHQWRKASKLLRRCFDLGFRWDMENTIFQLGACYFHLRDIDAYIEVYKRYLQMEPGSGWAAVNLGRALLYAGDYKRAVLWLSKARRLTGKNEVLKDLEKARRCLREAGAARRKRKNDIK